MTASVTKALVPTVPPLFRKILSLFPENYFRYCFAYGSGVYSQGKASGSNPMIDLIFAVDDSIGFHGQNMLWNPSHYSGIKHFGHTFVAGVQEKWPAKVYFNTNIPLQDEGIMLKYGVVNTADLVNDLLDWDYLYMAGRLHKPVLEIFPPVKDLKMALRQNLYSALHAALIILPEYFTERQLYATIVSLSYNGDFRMVIGENKDKVNNIVNNQIEYFRKLYRPYIKTFESYIEIPDGESADQMCVQDMDSNTRMYHLFQLPKVPQQALAKSWRRRNRNIRKDTEEILKDIARNPDVGELLAECLKDIVFSSSVQQSLKGIFTAGLKKSLAYGNSKLSKMKQSSL